MPERPHLPPAPEDAAGLAERIEAALEEAVLARDLEEIERLSSLLARTRGRRGG